MALSIATSFKQPAGRPVLLSVRPKYADRIASGDKKVEFRRVWTAQPVSELVLYSTSPASRLIAVASIAEIIHAPRSTLWGYATRLGGGITRRELFEYFQGVSHGFALILGNVRVLSPPRNPADHSKRFRPPQSFRFLSPKEFDALV